jgi:catechol 2,3-dioxygenase-like lactoylglutathione lyase family enzyme
VTLVGIDHVQLSMPAGGEDVARAFYGTLLGLDEVPKPPALAGRGGVWFADGPVAVHLGVEHDFRPAAKAHPAFVVDDLARLRERLAAASVVVTADDSGLRIDRCYVTDPFGNRIELVDARDAGFSRR